MNSDRRYLGRIVPRLEDPSLLRGEACFVDDIHLPHMLHAHFLRSPVAHGLLRHIGLERARKMSGVRAIFTYADLRSWHTCERIPVAVPGRGILFDVNSSVLVEREMTYVGEPVVLIVADSRAIAEDAAGAIDLEYDPLPVVADAREAVQEGSPRARLDCPTNIVAETGINFGDIDHAFAKAHLVVSERFKLSKGGGHAIETRGLVASFDKHQDLLTIWEATQMPHRSKAIVVNALGLAETQVRVLTPDVGGGFGPKGAFHPESLAIPTAALILNTPIKWIEDRYENFLACVLEHDQDWDMQAAFDDAGHLLGIRGQLYHDHGANTPYGIALPYNSGTNLIGPYRLPAYDLKIKLALTNKVPASATRGAGRSQGTFVMERLLDRAADRLAIARAEIRCRNFIPAEQLPYTFPVLQRDGTPMVYDSGNYPECQRIALVRAGFEDFENRREQARKEGKRLGLGLSAYVEATGRGPYESGEVRIGPSGKIIITTGATAQGQGTKTMLAQIACEIFGVPLDHVHVVAGDTAASPLGLGAYASRQTVTAGNAVHAAALVVADKAKRVAAEMLEADAQDIEIFEGVLRVKGVPDLKITLTDAAKALSGVPGFALPGNMAPGLAASVDFQPSGMTYSNGSHVAEVEVDVDTGLIKINRYVVAHDCGTIISPSGVEGQTIGGVAHGIGATLFEWMRYDENGQPLAVTYADYLLPTSDVVPRIEIEHMESPSPFNPLGVKGAGEAGTIGAPAAIIAAVEDALDDLDVFITDLPLTPVRLFELLKLASRSGRSL